MKKIYVESSKRTGDVAFVMEGYRSENEEKRRRLMAERRNFRRRRAATLK